MASIRQLFTALSRIESNLDSLNSNLDTVQHSLDSILTKLEKQADDAKQTSKARQEMLGRIEETCDQIEAVK